MNNIFRSIWSDALQTFVAVAEIVSTGRRVSDKRFRLRLLASSLVLTLWICSGFAGASDLPTGGTIVAGAGSIATSGQVMTIQQDSHKLIADWSSFSIGGHHTVNFVQPGRDAAALNRVLGDQVSEIRGALNANGQVFLVNPNGIVFGATAQVDVGSFVASTLNITNDDFLAGPYRFSGISSNAIINQGNINATDGGTIALIAAKIDNSGALTANSGNVLMGAGSTVLLDLGGPVKIEVKQAALDALIDQGGAIKADGGLVYLTAAAAGDLTSTVINHSGIIEAQTLTTGEKGEIYLMGDMANGRIEIAGTLDASAPNGGDGGFIETSAAQVQIDPQVHVTTLASEGNTGTWLIDPVDIIIAELDGTVSGQVLAGALANSNITLDTSGNGSCTEHICGNFGGSAGDIFIRDNIHVIAGNNGTDTTLTLKANHSIIMDSGKSITTDGNHNLNIVFWADSDGIAGGGIEIKEGALIDANGGHIWIGGGSETSTWNGLAVGDGYAQGIDMVGSSVLGTNITIAGNNGVVLGNVAALGNIDIVTLTGSLSLTGLIDTSDAQEGSAVILNAGKGAIAGDSTGGNIIVGMQEAIQLGQNGTAKLYSGSIADSIGLAAFIGSGSGRFRYNADANTDFSTNDWVPLGAGIYAIYREQPVLTVTPTSAGSIYGDAVNLAGVTGILSGYVNGDDATLADLSGTALFSTTANSNTNVGHYNIAYEGGLVNRIGYAINDDADSTGEYTITPRQSAVPDPNPIDSMASPIDTTVSQILQEVAGVNNQKKISVWGGNDTYYSSFPTDTFNNTFTIGGLDVVVISSQDSMSFAAGTTGQEAGTLDQAPASVDDPDAADPLLAALASGDGLDALIASVDESALEMAMSSGLAEGASPADALAQALATGGAPGWADSLLEALATGSGEVLGGAGLLGEVWQAALVEALLAGASPETALAMAAQTELAVQAVLAAELGTGMDAGLLEALAGGEGIGSPLTHVGGELPGGADSFAQALAEALASGMDVADALAQAHAIATLQTELAQTMPGASSPEATLLEALAGGEGIDAALTLAGGDLPGGTDSVVEALASGEFVPDFNLASGQFYVIDTGINIGGSNVLGGF